MTYKRDLVDPINDGEYDVMMMCPNQCGATWSANIGDYYTVDDDYEFTCDECKVALLLVKRVVSYEEI